MMRSAMSNGAFKGEWADDTTLDAFATQVERELASYDPAAYKRGCVVSFCRLGTAYLMLVVGTTST